jgi:hypothetical protein
MWRFTFLTPNGNITLSFEFEHEGYCHSYKHDFAVLEVFNDEQEGNLLWA